MKKELVSFCSPEETPPFGGVIHYKNPKYFYDHESIPVACTHFFTKDERIRKAYLAAGKIEHGVENKEKEEKVEVKTEEKKIEDMTWPELRSYASTLTDEPIKNKEMALKVIMDNKK